MDSSCLICASVSSCGCSVGDAALPPVRTLEEVRVTLVERVSEWPAQWLREGLEQGLEQQRALLCRMAAARFDEETAARSVGVLASITDPARLVEVGEWLGRCETGTEFLARINSAVAPT